MRWSSAVATGNQIALASRPFSTPFFFYISNKKITKISSGHTPPLDPSVQMMAVTDGHLSVAAKMSAVSRSSHKKQKFQRFRSLELNDLIQIELKSLAHFQNTLNQRKCEIDRPTRRITALTIDRPLDGTEWMILLIFCTDSSSDAFIFFPKCDLIVVLKLIDYNFIEMR